MYAVQPRSNPWNDYTAMILNKTDFDSMFNESPKNVYAYMFFLIQKTKYMIVPTAAVRKMMQIGFYLYLAAGALSVKDPYWFFHYHRHQAGSDYLQRVSASVLSFGQHTGHCPD